MVKALDRKMLRDLTRLKGQVATIAVVLACGIMALIMLESTVSSLNDSRDAYYSAQRFADVFARLERAPLSVVRRLETLPGVARVYDRLVKPVMLPMDEQPEPVTGRVVSIPADEEPPLNGVHLTEGRLPDRSADDEAVVLDQFARAYELRPGDRLPVVMNGALRHVQIVGLGMSPEYIFAMGGNEMIADARRFAVLWMRREAIAPAFQLEGAFNDVALRLEPGAQLAQVLADVDRELAPYGGFHAIDREKQLSHSALSGEIAQLEGMAVWIPLVFLGVAAFLVNIVVSRLILLERMQIAVLKALGYSSRRVALHYLGLVALIVILGAVLGVALGAWGGRGMTNMYTSFFRFPNMVYEITPGQVLLSIAFALVAAIGGALVSVFRVTKMPPAEAMRPAAPAHYRRSIWARLGLARAVGPAVTMVARELARRPVRFLLSSSGIAMGVGIYIMGTFSWDSFDYIMKEAFPRQNKGDFVITFAAPMPERAIRDLKHLPGVQVAEGFHFVPVRIHAGPRWRDAGILALPEPSELRRVYHRFEREIPMPEDGVVMTDKLAEVLGVAVGDRVEVEVLEGSFPTKEVAISALVDQPFGLQMWASRDWLDRLLGEESRINSAALTVDAEHKDAVRERLKEMPAVISAVSTDAIVRAYEKQTGSTVGFITWILALAAAAIAVGVVYNNARITLSTRSRELASLRVLGYRRREISGILLGELAAQVMLGIPLGFVLGRLWARLLVSSIDAEQMRLPLTIDLSTYAYAALIALGAGLLSALIVRRRLDKLDLVAVLKAAE